MFSLKNIRFLYEGTETRTDGEASPVRGIQVESLDISGSGVTAIIGPSGSGKTTLLSLLAGFIAPEISPDGHLTFFGKPYSRNGSPPGHVSFVFQSPMLLGAASGLLNVLQGRVGQTLSTSTRAMTGEDLHRWLQTLDLAKSDRPLMTKRAKLLSGGEAQRVAILRALVAEPDAILCDEPTSSLDEHNAYKAMKALVSWSHSRSRPVLWVTHNLEQADQFAENFVFVSGGRIFRPASELTERLREAPKGQRIGILREILRCAEDATASQTSSGEGEFDDASTELSLSRWQFSRWIANALSTDGLLSEQSERGVEGVMAPRGLRRLFAQTETAYRGEVGYVGRMIRRMLSYSRYGLGFIVFVLLLQITLADFFGGYARTYSNQKLQDPSVARIIFEHVIWPGEGTNTVDGWPRDLNNDETIPELQARLAKVIGDTENETGRIRTTVFGRRVVDGAALRFENAASQCQRWFPFTTVAIDQSDPILRQSVLTKGDSQFVEALHDLEKPRNSTVAGVPARAQLLFSEKRVKELRKHCEIANDGPIHVELAVGQAGQLKPLAGEISASVERFPPLYPVVPDLLMFEKDFQRAVQRFDQGGGGPFRVAHAYFPIDAFSSVETALRDLGYFPRDDSAAAVETLQTIKSAADIAPSTIRYLNLAACLIVISLVIGNILQLNKRVLALYMAQGLQMRDVMAVLILHLLPAFVFATLLVIGVVFILWPFAAQYLQVEGIDIWILRDTALWTSIGLVFLFGFAALASVVSVWWWITQRSLKTHLQD